MQLSCLGSDSEQLKNQDKFLGGDIMHELELTPILHTSVMLDEVLGYLNLRPGNIIVDATIGTAGHSLEILKRIMPGGKLIGIDRDSDSLSIAKERLRDYSDTCEFVYANFIDIDTILTKLNIEKIDGILFDLGLSSFQLADPQRGFSFQKEGPLDMRFDRNSYISAYDLINNLTEEEVSNLLWVFGQERWHNRIARLLVREREKQPIATTAQLKNIVLKAVPYRYRHCRIHPATRSFQAIRIAVNRELEVLEEALTKAVERLNKTARICVISFHSLEDRIVKFKFRNFSHNEVLKIITPKPLVPTQGEIKENPSSRSAKLRVAEKL
jgi:16S rRNA (cytosine1402-N4)-methyltransferase